jgi:xylulokinase
VSDASLTVGTGAQVIRPVAVPVNRAEAGVHLFRLATPDGWYQMGATLSAGLSLNWVREVLNATWEELYASASAGSEDKDPIFAPHLTGERTPYCDPSLRGSWTSLALASDRASLLRSALEGTAFAIRDALDALLGPAGPAPAGLRLAGLRLAGGGTLAPGWRQLLADVLGVPLYAVEVPAASGRGAALLGAIAAGLLGFDDCAGPLAPPATLAAEPDPGRAGLYAERHGRFTGVVLALRSSGSGSS